MRLGDVERHLAKIRRVGLTLLLAVILLLSRGVTLLRNPPEHVWVSNSLFLGACFLFFMLWAITASVVHYGHETQSTARPPVAIPGIGAALAIPVALGTALFALLATGATLLDIELGLLAACLIVLTAIGVHEVRHAWARAATPDDRPWWKRVVAR